MTVYKSDPAARAFGEGNRKRLLSQYFEHSGPVTLENAWEHIYRLLLWIDQTTSLAHCYESDKSQPGRPWYVRSLRFHGWVAEQLGTRPGTLGEEIDWLFRAASKDLAATAVVERHELARQQRIPFESRGFPEPARDSELVEIIVDVLGPWLSRDPPAEVLQSLSERVYEYIRIENKRKNLVGEGFEDALAAVVAQIPETRDFDLRTRQALHDLPGFYDAPEGEKTKKVDLALIQDEGNRRTLLTVKWSIRADREEQFVSDFKMYGRLNRVNNPWDYVLITNEFDPARLAAACERQIDGRELFTTVVHVNPRGVLAAYDLKPKRSAVKVLNHVESQRLISLETWLRRLVRGDSRK